MRFFILAFIILSAGCTKDDDITTTPDPDPPSSNLQTADKYVGNYSVIEDTEYDSSTVHYTKHYEFEGKIIKVDSNKIKAIQLNRNPKPIWTLMADTLPLTINKAKDSLYYSYWSYTTLKAKSISPDTLKIMYDTYLNINPLYYRVKLVWIKK